MNDSQGDDGMVARWSELVARITKILGVITSYSIHYTKLYELTHDQVARVSAVSTWH